MKLTETQYAKLWKAHRIEELAKKAVEPDQDVLLVKSALQTAILDIMKSGKWYTSNEIAKRLNKNPDMVEKTMQKMRKVRILTFERVSDFSTFKLNEV